MNYLLLLAILSIPVLAPYFLIRSARTSSMNRRGFYGILVAATVCASFAGCTPRAAFSLKYPTQQIQPGVLAVSRADMERCDRYQGTTPMAMDVNCPAQGGFISRESGSDDLATGSPWRMQQDGTIWIKCSDPAHMTHQQLAALKAALAVKQARVVVRDL